MKSLIVSAPFGNWVSSPFSTSTLGTYTVENRAGRWRWWMAWRIIRTLRRLRRLGAWTNALSLPSPGLAHLVSLCEKDEKHCADKVVSIHGFDDREWKVLIDHMADVVKPLATEINSSCPNVPNGYGVPPWLFDYAMQAGLDVIVKLPPVRWRATFDLARKAGVKRFHCTNTLPTPAGGMSGKPLKAVALDVVKAVKDIDPSVEVIGGGGITSPEDIDDYSRAGATKFAVGSTLLNGWHLFLPWVRRDLLARLAARASMRVVAPAQT